jgi:hypothetical protein
MRKALLIVLSSLILIASIAKLAERTLSAAIFSIWFLIVVFLYRRFSRYAPEAPYACHAAAAIALSLGVVTVIAGLGHSVAVVSLALRDAQDRPLTILRFTTGAMLLYSGAMNVAVHRAIQAGRNWAVAVGAATAVLFCLYLFFFLLFHLPGTGGTVRPMLGLWSVYLLWLGAALTSRREDDRLRADS